MAERGDKSWRGKGATVGWRSAPPGLKPKDLVGIPWRVALALQAAGWWLRSDCIFHKPNPQPEAAIDRPARAHEYVFLLTKSEHYFYDAFAVLEPTTGGAHARGKGVNPKAKASRSAGDVRQNESFSAAVNGLVDKRNLRTVWTIASEPSGEEHYAAFPRELARRCILAGTSERGCCDSCGAPVRRVVEKVRLRDGVPCDEKSATITSRRTVGWKQTCSCGAGVAPCTVLDPFGGSGTVGIVANELGRHATLVELNPAYVEIAERRCAQTSLFAQAPAPEAAE